MDCTDCSNTSYDGSLISWGMMLWSVPGSDGNLKALLFFFFTVEFLCSFDIVFVSLKTKGVKDIPE